MYHFFLKQIIFWFYLRLKLSPSPSTQVSVSRITGSSSRSSKRKRVESKDIPEVGGEGKLLVSEEATASGAVTISPTDMNGNAVTLTNDTAQVRKLLLARAMLANVQITFHFCLAPHVIQPYYSTFPA